jgi:hypothetical protein
MNVVFTTEQYRKEVPTISNLLTSCPILSRTSIDLSKAVTINVSGYTYLH